MTTTVKSDLLGIKSRLEQIEASLSKQSKQIEERESKWEKMDSNIKAYKTKEIKKVNLNIGGVVYSSTIGTLLSDKTSIFNKILSSKEIDLNDELYIERRGDLFAIILEYLRTGNFNYKLYKKAKLLEIKEEADFYNIEKIYNEIDELTKDIEIVDFKYSGDYNFKGERAGTQKLADVKDKNNLNTGICTNSPGYIIFELKTISEFQKIEVAGYQGNKTLWYPGNGSGAKIYTSLDNEKWTQIGTLSSSFANKIAVINLKEKAIAKYVKFEHTAYVGLGYCYFVRTELE